MENLSDYTIRCTGEQTRKAHELGARIEYAKVIDTINGNSTRIPEGTGEFYLIPTAEQMRGWLEGRGMFCEVRHYEYFYHSYVDGIYLGPFSSRKEATLAAIDAALEYLVEKNLIK